MSKEKRGVIWTRSAEDWPLDRTYFSNEVSVIQVPCIRTEPVSPPKLEENQQVDALMLTSPKAVGFAFKDPTIRNLFGRVPCFCFGSSTASAMLQHKVTPELLASTNGEAFTKALTTAPFDRTILHPRPESVAFEPEAILSKAGKSYLAYPLFRTVEGAWDPEGHPFSPQQLMHLLTFHRIIAFASPSAVRGILTTLGPLANDLAEVPTLHGIAIGATTEAAMTGYFSKTTIAPAPTARDLARTAQQILAAD